MTLQVRGEARAWAARAARWYERQARLGDAFRVALLAALRRIEKHSRLYAGVHRDLRRAPLHRFPYSLYFTHDERQGTLTVFAVVHDARKPEIWKGRR